MVEHRLVPAFARSVSNDLRINCRASSVLAPACQESVPGGHAVVGVVSLHSAPLTLPTFLHLGVPEFFRLVRALRVILPSDNWSIAHLSVVDGYQASEVDPHKLALTEELMEEVLGEAQACGIGEPVLISWGPSGDCQGFYL